MTSPSPDPTSPTPEAPQSGAETAVRSVSGLCFEPPAGSVLRLPANCANCAEPAGASARLNPPWGVRQRALLVPYCARCARRLEQHRTRNAVAVGAAFCLGLVAALGLPLVPAPWTLFSYGATVTAVAALPAVVAWFLAARRVPEPGQTSAEVALWWDKGTLRGTNAAWMAELAAQNRQPQPSANPPTDGVSAGSQPRPSDDPTAREAAPLRSLSPRTASRPFGWQGLVFPFTFAALSPGLFQWLFPTLVVLNLSPAEFELVIDGASRGVVGVTSLESTQAATRLSLGAGTHALEARPRGESADAPPTTYRVDVAIEAGEEYLFAPGSDGYCFWLERTAYGSAAGKSRRQTLGGKDGFFRLPAAIDTWFAANPEPNADRVSTGGEMVALRQSRCQ